MKKMGKRISYIRWYLGLLNPHISDWDKRLVSDNLSDWNIKGATKLPYLFYSFATESILLPIGNWDTSSVTDMEGMFEFITMPVEGGKTIQPDISNWDVSKVTNMNYMFRFARDFNQDISNWDVSNVRSMKLMFRGSSAFNQNLSKWRLDNLKDVKYMFFNSNITLKDIESWGWMDQRSDLDWEKAVIKTYEDLEHDLIIDANKVNLYDVDFTPKK